MAATTPICDFGWKAVDFSLPGLDGRAVSLADVRGPQGTLIMFICNHCPYVKAIAGRLVEECKALSALGIGIAAIMPNDTQAYPEDDLPGMQEFAARHGFFFPYLIDRTQAAARAYGAVCTPDFFGFNAALELQYRGRMDESRTTLVPNAKRELFQAMKQVAETGRGPAEQIPSMGCSVKWRNAA